MTDEEDKPITHEQAADIFYRVIIPAIQADLGCRSLFAFKMAKAAVDAMFRDWREMIGEPATHCFEHDEERERGVCWVCEYEAKNGTTVGP